MSSVSLISVMGLPLQCTADYIAIAVRESCLHYFCVSKGGAGVQDIAAIKKTCKKKIKAKIIPSFKSTGFHLCYLEK